MQLLTTEAKIHVGIYKRTCNFPPISCYISSNKIKYGTTLEIHVNIKWYLFLLIFGLLLSLKWVKRGLQN